MAKFGRLKKLSVDGKTFAFELPEAHVASFSEHVPVIHLAHMGRGNAAYFNARMTSGANGMARATRKRSAKEINEMAMKEAISLDQDRELMPLHVIKGWDHLYDDDGKLVEFSVEEATELVMQLPDDVIDRMRHEAGDVRNYRDVEALDPEAAEALAGK